MDEASRSVDRIVAKPKRRTKAATIADIEEFLDNLEGAETRWSVPGLEDPNSPSAERFVLKIGDLEDC